MKKLNGLLQLSSLPRGSVVILLISLVISTVIGAHALDRDGSVAATNDLLLVNTARLVGQSEYQLQRTYVGRVEAGRSSTLGFELSGKIERILVDEGDTVTAGQPLARLDTARLEARRGELQASLREARHRQQLAASTLARMEQALAYKGVTRQQVDEARERRDSANAGVDLINSSLNTLDVELNKSVLLSPYTGIITRRLLDEGVVVSGGNPLLAIQEQKQAVGRIGVAGNVIDQLQPGSNVTVQVDGVQQAAQISHVLPIRDLSVRTVDVLLKLSDPLARPGDLVELHLLTRIETPGYWVPVSALEEGDRGLWTIYIASPDSDSGEHRISARFVNIIQQQGNLVYIDTFEQDDLLYVVNGLQRIVPGTVVRINDISANQQVALTEDLQ